MYCTLRAERLESALTVTTYINLGAAFISRPVQLSSKAREEFFCRFPDLFRSSALSLRFLRKLFKCGINASSSHPNWDSLSKVASMGFLGFKTGKDFESPSSLKTFERISFPLDSDLINESYCASFRWEKNPRLRDSVSRLGWDPTKKRLRPTRRSNFTEVSLREKRIHAQLSGYPNFNTHKK